MNVVRRTATGLEMAGTTLTAIVAAGSLLTMLLSVVAFGAQARQQLQDATPTTRTDSVVRALARHDSLLSDIRFDLRHLRAEVMGINCQTTGYPSPFCDEVPRVPPAPGLPGRIRK